MKRTGKLTGHISTNPSIIEGWNIDISKYGTSNTVSMTGKIGERMVLVPSDLDIEKLEKEYFEERGKQ